jgi:hypothetical protein
VESFNIFSTWAAVLTFMFSKDLFAPYFIQKCIHPNLLVQIQSYRLNPTYSYLLYTCVCLIDYFNYVRGVKSLSLSNFVCAPFCSCMSPFWGSIPALQQLPGPGMTTARFQA